MFERQNPPVHRDFLIKIEKMILMVYAVYFHISVYICLEREGERERGGQLTDRQTQRERERQRERVSTKTYLNWDDMPFSIVSQVYSHLALFTLRASAAQRKASVDTPSAQ